MIEARALVSKFVARRARHGAVLAALVVCAAPLVAEATSPPPGALRDGLVASATSSTQSLAPDFRTAAWPFLKPPRRALFESVPATPHPAVPRIVVPEKGATAYGTGTLIDVRDQYGLVVTNWHVVRDARGDVEVVFPGGFRSQARPLKVDEDWDLAALVIWRPPAAPVKLAERAPRPGDLLTIHGYGQGDYRIATGRCTTYYAPKVNYPLEMVELDVEARQGDSGGPIFNDRGDLAGVLFGAGQGTTLGSFAPRVNMFLATLAPDIGRAGEQLQVAAADRPAPKVQPVSGGGAEWPSSPWRPPGVEAGYLGTEVPRPSEPVADVASSDGLAASAASDAPLTWRDITQSDWYDPLKSLLALIGLVAIALQLVKLVR